MPLAHALAELLQQARTLPDTALMRIVPSPATGFQQFLAVAGAAAVLLPYLLLAGAVWAALRVRKSFEAAKASMDEIGQHLRSLAENANRITADVASVSDTLRTQVESVHETVEYANRRARHAVTVLADRVDEFNGALAAVQQDTQSVIVTALAALTGVRAGVSALRKKKRPEREPASAPAETDDDTPPDLPARPRLRRRARGDR
jgi:uncharacterized protein YoxC